MDIAYITNTDEFPMKSMKVAFGNNENTKERNWSRGFIEVLYMTAMETVGLHTPPSTGLNGPPFSKI